MHWHNVRMTELGGRARFTQKAVAGGVAGSTGEQHLDRDQTIQHAVTREPDGAHATLTQRPHDIEGRADCFRDDRVRLGSRQGTGHPLELQIKRCFGSPGFDLLAFGRRHAVVGTPYRRDPTSNSSASARCSSAMWWSPRSTRRRYAQTRMSAARSPSGTSNL